MFTNMGKGLYACVARLPLLSRKSRDQEHFTQIGRFNVAIRGKLLKTVNENISRKPIMDTGDHDFEFGDENDMESMIDSYNKNDESTMGSIDGRSDSVCDGSTLGGEDDYMSNIALYDGYDSYNESGESSDEEEELPRGELLAAHLKGIVPTKPTPFRFMNGKDGMATCEKCGTVGIKHAFYSKSKRFCSLSCSRSFATAQREGKPLPPKPVIARKGNKGITQTKKPISKANSHLYSKSGKPETVRGFDWGPYLSSGCGDGANISSFIHAPMNESWEQISIGMKIECLNHDTDLPYSVFWIAAVMKLAGYKALVRYEGFSGDSSKDFWLNLCSKDVHSVGWCASFGKPLVPPKSIQHKYADWKSYLVARLTGSRTLPGSFHNKATEYMTSFKLKKGMRVEVVDKMCVSAMRVALVNENIGGRVRLNYEDSKDENDDFWCHTYSPLIHYVGWSQEVNHKLHCSQEYRSKCLTKVTMQKYDPTDSTPDMFLKNKDSKTNLKFQVGMKLEAIDPLNLSAVCVATVMKVLKTNYLMIGIDGSAAQNGSDWFCYHSSSPCIFPVGFCEINGIVLTPPRGYKGPFKWFEYLKQTKSVAAPVKLFDKEIPKHGFKPGHKLEAVDLMEPRLICVGTITKVVGRLLRVHFDGWENEYDQWVDCETPDLYPVGWCEMMNYSLEGPRMKIEQQGMNNLPMSKKRKSKAQLYKGPRKKKKSKSPVKPGVNYTDSTDHLQYPPYVSLTAEAVAANLPPMLDTHASDSFKVKVEPGMETSTGQDAPPVLSPLEAPPSRAQNISRTASMPVITDFKTDSNSNTNENASANQSNQHLLSKLTSPITKTDTSNSSLNQSNDSTQLKPAPPSVGEKVTLSMTTRHQTVLPDHWTIIDVYQFLHVNDCAAYCESFKKKGIDGRRFMALTKEEIVSLTGMKVGPSLRIYDLIQYLKQHFERKLRQDSS
ncbi:hypothetical protein SNE40_016844 [Patella caerulea]|uniref:Uncharacterized protein n=1 Tax=Patella caerulea TaxID=87958 RepID=A0AAN8JAS0_PATCE